MVKLLTKAKTILKADRYTESQLRDTITDLFSSAIDLLLQDRQTPFTESPDNWYEGE